jgi:hypothetical protein
MASRSDGARLTRAAQGTVGSQRLSRELKPMSNLFRRAGSAIARIVQSTSDPAASANEVQLYSKDDAGTVKLYMRDSAGTITQVGAGGGGTDFSPTIDVNTTFGGLSATVNNWTPDGFVPGTTKWVNILSQDGQSQSIGGLSVGQVDGTVVTICQANPVGPNNVFTLLSESAGSLAANRFICGSSAYSGPGRFVTLRYVGALQRWVQLLSTT